MTAALGALLVIAAVLLGALVLRLRTARQDAEQRLGELRRRDARMRELLADLAHDVRTPLASLKLGLTGEADPVALRAEVEHLDALFANVATLIQLEATSIPLDLREQDLRPVLERIGQRFAVLAKDRGVALATSVPGEEVRARVDPVAFEQLVGNLVHNAVKFCRAHVAVLLLAEGGRAVVRVLDDGPGFDAEELGRLTERHFRGRASLDRGRPGQGLGLAIARALADRHDGELVLRRDEEGTVAEVVLAAR